MIGAKKSGRKSSRVVSAVLGFAALAQVSLPIAAQADERHEGHRIEVRHDFPHGYVHHEWPRERFYRGVRVYRYWGPRYVGFGWFYDDAAAWAFLGFTAWQLALYAELNEAQLRAQEAAIVEASTAPIGEPIVWNDGPASGEVEAIRDGHTTDGRACREFQQQVTIGGRSQQAYGTACQQPDGSWQIVKQP